MDFRIHKMVISDYDKAYRPWEQTEGQEQALFSSYQLYCFESPLLNSDILQKNLDQNANIIIAA